MNAVIGNLVTSYESFGIGRVILFLHGWGSSKKAFRLIADPLAQHFQVIALDLPGFGETQFPREAAWDVEKYARFVQEFLDKLEVKKLIIIGHSFGGRIAIKFAKLFPERVEKLVLVATAGVRPKPGLRAAALRFLAKIGKGLMSKNMQERFIRQFGSPDYQQAGRLRETFKKVVNEDLVSDARTVIAPTLIIWGEKDTEVPLRDGEIFYQAIKNSRLVVIPTAGHYPFLDKSREFLSWTQKFLEE
jgi:pimeloyl-ACP methyl ester carboxylesterase